MIAQLAVQSHAWQREAYTISTDRGRLDLDVIHRFLSTSYWSPGIPREIIARGIANSTCFGVHHQRDGQVGFARVVSDHATFGYLADVFVVESHRGRGLSKWLMECILAHPDLQGFRRWMLGTRDARGLYARFGFTDLAAGSHWMEKWNPGVYEAAASPRA